MSARSFLRRARGRRSRRAAAMRIASSRLKRSPGLVVTATSASVSATPPPHNRASRQPATRNACRGITSTHAGSAPRHIAIPPHRDTARFRSIASPVASCAAPIRRPGFDNLHQPAHLTPTNALLSQLQARPGCAPRREHRHREGQRQSDSSPRAAHAEEEGLAVAARDMTAFPDWRGVGSRRSRRPGSRSGPAPSARSTARLTRASSRRSTSVTSGARHGLTSSLASTYRARPETLASRAKQACPRGPGRRDLDALRDP